MAWGGGVGLHLPTARLLSPAMNVILSNVILKSRSTPNHSIHSENMTWLASCSALSHCLPTLGAPATPSTAPRKMYTVPPPSYGAPTSNYIDKKQKLSNVIICLSFPKLCFLIAPHNNQVEVQFLHIILTFSSMDSLVPTPPICSELTLIPQNPGSRLCSGHPPC